MLRNQFSNVALGTLGIAKKFIDVVYYAYKITNGQLTIEQAPFLYTWLQDASPILQGWWTLNFPSSVVVQARIHKLLESYFARYSNYSLSFI